MKSVWGNFPEKSIILNMIKSQREKACLVRHQGNGRERHQRACLCPPKGGVQLHDTFPDHLYHVVYISYSPTAARGLLPQHRGRGYSTRIRAGPRLCYIVLYCTVLCHSPPMTHTILSLHKGGEIALSWRFFDSIPPNKSQRIAQEWSGRKATPFNTYRTWTWTWTWTIIAYHCFLMYLLCGHRLKEGGGCTAILWFYLENNVIGE